MKSEQGSALVLVMFIVLLLTILGLAVLGATIGGAQRSETRESDVQSLHLAQKGLNEAAAYIQSELKGLQLEDIDPESLGIILAKLDDNKASLKVATELQSSSRGSVDGIKYDDTKDKNQKTKPVYPVYHQYQLQGSGQRSGTDTEAAGHYRQLSRLPEVCIRLREDSPAEWSSCA